MIVCPWKDLGRYAPIIPGLEEAVKLVEGLESLEPATYPLSGGGRVMVQRGTTTPIDEADIEAHRLYLDIQYIVRGQEVVGWAPLADLTPNAPFNLEKDKGRYAGRCEYITIPAGSCYVVFPEDGHMPSRHLEKPNDYQKIVVKLKV